MRRVQTPLRVRKPVRWCVEPSTTSRDVGSLARRCVSASHCDTASVACRGWFKLGLGTRAKTPPASATFGWFRVQSSGFLRTRSPSLPPCLLPLESDLCLRLLRVVSARGGRTQCVFRGRTHKQAGLRKSHAGMLLGKHARAEPELEPEPGVCALR
eukprot:1269493-Rhodomonas_salina.2